MVTRDIRFLFGDRYWGGSVTVINGVTETNGQVKTGLFGLRPSKAVFDRLVAGLKRGGMEFTNNEQGYVSKVLEREWQAVPEYTRMPRVSDVVCVCVCVYVCMCVY